MTRFDEVKATFWGEGLYGVQPPLTDVAALDAELRPGVRLPASLLELLRIRNGGPVAAPWNAFPTDVPTSWSENHVPHDDLLGIGRHDGQWGLPSPLVPLSGDGHWWIALDCRTCGAQGGPSVTWFDTEVPAELSLAEDFRTFIERLTAAHSLELAAADGRRSSS
ncbi:SMI1/KNR4 family protein [Streptomyces sp. NPDC002476]|uniref:SMI1/KNR4 family protein n=1 Tax=Streptomyces sp. NPDC002476 TaxID=3364648 RepID=UPI0036C2B3B6